MLCVIRRAVARRAGRACAGLARERVRFVRSGRLVAAVGDVAAVPAPRLENLRGHDRVVRRLAGATRAALPARFGTVVETARMPCGGRCGRAAAPSLRALARRRLASR